MMQDFKTGKVAMIINGPWCWKEIEQAGVPFGVADLPTINNQQPKPFIGVLGAMINKNSRKKAQAKAFIENYLLADKGLRTVNADVPIGVPADKAFFAEVLKSKKFYGSLNFIYQGKPMPSNDEMRAFWDSMSGALNQIANGKQTPKAALDDAARKITGI